MTIWTLIQVVFDIFAALGFFVLVMRLNRAPKDDPRLSRGLQLLQSKISVLEDLSDRTEAQASQLSAILEQKCREVQAKVQIAEQHVHEIRVSMDRSLEVAKIFQDKIPHQEIIERQNTLKYVQAARLAHQGLDSEQISQQIDLPKGEIEFITKVNRDQLMFNEDQLPAWARDSQSPPQPSQPNSMQAHQAMPAHQSISQQHAMSPQHAMQPRTAIEAFESQASQADMAERQRLIENLSRLQNEMQSLDRQLARESAGRDLSSAFEAPKVELASLHKIGEEFRRACDEAAIENEKPAISSLLPPLEQLNSLIPHLFTPMPEMASGPVPADVLQDKQSSLNVGASPEGAEAPKTSPSQEDARAAARAKVRAALSQMRPATPAPLHPSPELAAAKAAASPSQMPVASGPQAGAKANAPLIRKVEFPRIDKGPKA